MFIILHIAHEEDFGNIRIPGSGEAGHDFEKKNSKCIIFAKHEPDRQNGDRDPDRH